MPSCVPSRNVTSSKPRPKKASSPRRRALRLRPSRLYALHSQGREIYWRYRELQPPESSGLGRTLAALSGYRLCDPDPVASAAGLKDWYIKRFRRPGFTVELGLGQNPLPYQQFDCIYREFARALAAALLM